MCDQIILNIELTIKIRTLFKRKRNTDLYGFQRNLKLKAWMLSKKVSTCGRVPPTGYWWRLCGGSRRYQRTRQSLGRSAWAALARCSAAGGR